MYAVNPARGWLPWAVLAPVLGILFVAVPLVACSRILERLALVDAGGSPVGYAGLVAFLLLPFGAIALAVLAWVRVVERRPLATIGLGTPGGWPAYGRGIGGGMATSLAVVLAITLAGGFAVNGFGKAFGTPTALPQVGLLFACFVVQAGAEEILFRGWMLSVVQRKSNAVVAVAATSAVFAFLHYVPQQPPLMTANMVLYSVFAGCLALDANHLWGVMGWHTGWNWLLATGFEVPVTGIDAHLPALVVSLSPSGPDYLTGGADGPEGSVLCSVFFIGATLVMLARIVRRHRAARAQQPRPTRA